MFSSSLPRAHRCRAVALSSFAASLSLLAVDAAAQVPGNRNGIRLYNEPETTFLHSFPSYFTTGNVAGDSLWQLTSRDVLRHASGDMELTAVVLPIFVANYRGPGQVELPDLELRETRQAPGAPVGCLEPDFAAAPLGSAVLGAITLPTGGAFRVEVSLLGGVGQTGIAIPNGDVALNVLATPGESSTTPNSVRLLISLEGSAADRAGCGFGALGTRAAATQDLVRRPPHFELQSELAFREPVMFAVRDDPRGGVDEGRGAIDFRITNNARIGWRAEAFQGIGGVLLPFFSFTGASTMLPIQGQFLLLDPDPFLDMLIIFQQADAILSNGAVPPATDGTWDTFLFSIPRNPQLLGVTLNCAGVIIDANGNTIDATNTVTTRLTL
ncbi:MAG: hypothetical protein JNM84_09040 [Planctomycetes bacterium]|nr:hypothetical protein [Planctomycetota bacterium]